MKKRLLLYAFWVVLLARTVFAQSFDGPLDVLVEIFSLDFLDADFDTRIAAVGRFLIWLIVFTIVYEILRKLPIGKTTASNRASGVIAFAVAGITAIGIPNSVIVVIVTAYGGFLAWLLFVLLILIVLILNYRVITPNAFGNCLAHLMRFLNLLLLLWISSMISGTLAPELAFSQSVDSLLATAASWLKVIVTVLAFIELFQILSCFGGGKDEDKAMLDLRREEDDLKHIESDEAHEKADEDATGKIIDKQGDNLDEQQKILDAQAAINQALANKLQALENNYINNSPQQTINDAREIKNMIDMQGQNDGALIQLQIELIRNLQDSLKTIKDAIDRNADEIRRVADMIARSKEVIHEVDPNAHRDVNIHVQNDLRDLIKYHQELTDNSKHLVDIRDLVTSTITNGAKGVRGTQTGRGRRTRKQATEDDYDKVHEFLDKIIGGFDPATGKPKSISDMQRWFDNLNKYMVLFHRKYEGDREISENQELVLKKAKQILAEIDQKRKTPRQRTERKNLEESIKLLERDVHR